MNYWYFVDGIFISEIVWLIQKGNVWFWMDTDIECGMLCDKEVTHRDRWINIIIKLWQTQSCYVPSCATPIKHELPHQTKFHILFLILSFFLTTMMQEDINSCTKHVCEPFKAFGRRCTRLAKEQRARFYILRRCITMLVCWKEWNYALSFNVFSLCCTKDALG